MPDLRLAAGNAILEIAPGVGGAIASFTLDGVDVLRPTPHEARESGNVRLHACYPLVPYSNRIAHARVRFDGREYVLARNFGDSPHSIHGVGWQQPWKVVSASDRHAQLALDHDARGDAATSWPWPFRALQTFALAPEANGTMLTSRLAIHNTGERPCPFGLGWHPFFPKPPDTMLAFSATHVWENDATLIPVTRVEVPEARKFGAPRAVADIVLDHVFESATGFATIAWPARGVSALIDADSALDRRVVFVPRGRDFLAFEPVSHMTDAFNRAARGESATGTRVLPPNTGFSCTMRIHARATA